MASKILNRPSGIVLSSSIPDFVISTENSYLNIRLSTLDNIVLLSERYYAAEEVVTLYELASLVEAHMRSVSASLLRFKLEAFGSSLSSPEDSCYFSVLFCDRFSVCTDVDSFLRENFLTTFSTRRVPARTDHILHFYASDRESLEARIDYAVREGKDSMHHGSLVLNHGEEAITQDIYSVVIRHSDIIAHTAASLDISAFGLSVVSFVVTVGNRSVTFFVDPSLGELDYFRFRNCFNIPEVAYLPAITTAKTDVDRSTAIINGSSQFYDQSVTKTYQAEVSTLTEAESAWIDQLLTSHEVSRPVLNPCDDTEPIIYAPVLITDSTCELSNSNESLNSVKFTWRFAINRPLAHLAASPGIFTLPFNTPFS